MVKIRVGLPSNDAEAQGVIVNDNMVLGLSIRCLTLRRMSQKDDAAMGSSSPRLLHHVKLAGRLHPCVGAHEKKATVEGLIAPEADGGEILLFSDRLSSSK